MKKVKPFMFLQKGFFDADYLISIDWNKLYIEYIVDFAYYWRREVCLFKIIWDKIHTRTIEYETADDYSIWFGQWFKSYYMVRNWICVDEQPKNKYKDWDELEFFYFEEKWRREKFIWKETERWVDDRFTETAITYIIYHALWKEKAKEYGEMAIKRLSTKKLMNHKAKLEKLYEKYWTKLVYDWYESVDFDCQLVPEKEWENLREEEEELEDWISGMWTKRRLWNIEEIKIIMKNWNLPDDKERNFKEDAIDYAKSKERN